MKKILCVTLAALVMAALAIPVLGYEYWNEAVSVTAAYGTPNIDGKVGAGEWDAAVAIEIPLTGDPLEDEGYALYQGEWANARKNGDFSDTFKLMWDENYLYILEVRKDNAVNLYGNATMPWETDGTLVFLMPVDDGSVDNAVNPDGVHHHIFFVPGNGSGEVGGDLMDRYGDIASGTQMTIDVEGGKVAASTTNDGYIVEVAVPWSQLGEGLTADFKGPHENMKLGFSLVLHDSDYTDGTTGFVKQICWGYIPENLPVNGYDYGGWGVLTLSPKPVTETPAEEAPAAEAPADTAAPVTADFGTVMAIAASFAAAGALSILRKKR